MLGTDFPLFILAHGGPIYACVFFFFALPPVVGFLIGCHRHGTSYAAARWYYVLAYYVVTLGSLMFVLGESERRSTPMTDALFEGLVRVFMIALVCGPFLGVWLIGSRRPKKPPFPPGHCQSCGYDLTGNVSGVCPECGTLTAAS